MATTCLSFVFVLAVSTVVLNMCGCEQHVVQWTVEGTNEGHLNVDLGDIVVMNCSRYLYCNIIYVEDREQYDNCNESVTDGKVVKIGNCLVDLTGIRNYTERIQGLSTVIEDSNIIDYKNGVNYYFLSFADGTAQSVRQSPNSGGLCEDGLKMIISVGSTSSRISQATPIATPVPPTTQGAGKGSGDTSFPVNTAIVIPVGVVIIIIIVVIVPILIFICYKWKSNNDNYDCEKNKTKKKKKEEWNKGGDEKDKTDGKEEIPGKEDNGKNQEISRETEIAGEGTETAGEGTQTQGKSGIGINGTEQNVETGDKQTKNQDETKKLKKTDGKSADGTQQSVVRGEKKPKKAAPGPRNTGLSYDRDRSSSASQPPDRRKNTDPLNQKKIPPIDPKTAQTSPSTQTTVYRPAPAPPLDKKAKKPGQENRKGSQKVRTPTHGSRSGPQPKKNLTTKSSRPEPPTSKTKDSDTAHSLQQNALPGRTATKTTSTSGARSPKRAWS